MSFSNAFVPCNIILLITWFISCIFVMANFLWEGSCRCLMNTEKHYRTVYRMAIIYGISLIDFKKAIIYGISLILKKPSTVLIESLWKIVRSYGIPQLPKDIIKSFNVNFRCRVGNTNRILSRLCNVINTPHHRVIMNTTSDILRGITWVTFTTADLDFAADNALFSFTKLNPQSCPLYRDINIYIK